MGYKIAQFAKLTGISAHTLRYYEKEGLITPLRNLQGYREYRDNDLAWIEFIVSIRPSPIADAKHEVATHQYPYLYGSATVLAHQTNKHKHPIHSNELTESAT